MPPRRLALYLALAAAPPLLFMAQRLALFADGGKWAALGDGLNFWTAASLALHGHAAVAFNPAAFAGYAHGLYGGSQRMWAYPPSYMLTELPFALLPPVPGVLAYDAAGFLLLFFSLRGSGFSPGFCAAILLSPAALACLADHQNNTFFTAALLAGLVLAETRPWVGGLLIGLLTMKPQLGILLPVFWLARGNYRAIASAGLTAMALVALSTAIFGWQCWVLFLHTTLPIMGHYMEALTAKPAGGPRAMIMSPYSLVRQFCPGATAARLVQAGFTLAALGLAFALGRARTLPQGITLPCLLLLSSLASPYIWYYDMIPASLAAAWLVAPRLNHGLSSGPLLALAGLWITPGIAAQAAMLNLPTFMPVFVTAMLAYVWLGRPEPGNQKL